MYSERKYRSEPLVFEQIQYSKNVLTGRQEDGVRVYNTHVLKIKRILTIHPTVRLIATVVKSKVHCIATF
jgi:hypothetical protein